MKKIVFLIALCTFCAAIYCSLSAQKKEQSGAKPELAVIEFNTNKNSVKIKQDAATIRSIVEVRLSRSGKFRIITRDKIDALLKNQRIQASDISSDENIKKLRMTNVGYIVTGTINAVDEDYSVVINVIDVSTGRVRGEDGFMGSSSKDLQAGITNLVDKFIAGMSIDGGKIIQRQGASKIGEVGPGGGIIFYVEGNTSMEVSRILGDYEWEEAVKAAKDYRGGGYSDWYLPSKDELSSIYNNLQKNGISNLGEAVYWSSSQYSTDSAWNLNFANGSQSYYYKYSIYGVRAVRAF